MTLPKTTCFPSRKSHGAVVTKNYNVLVTLRNNTRVRKALARLRSTYLAAVRVGTRVGLFSAMSLRKNVPGLVMPHHRQQSWTSMFHLEILVLDIDGVVRGRDKALCR